MRDGERRVDRKFATVKVCRGLRGGRETIFVRCIR